MKIVQLIKISCFFTLILLLSGCWDQKNIDERAYVVAIGIDKGEKDDKVSVTYLISNPELSKQEGGSNEPNREIITFQSPDLISAKNIANTVVAKEITYTLLSLILVSEEMAKDDNFIRWMYDVTKEREVTRNIPFIVTKENTSNFLLENKPKLETRVHKYFELILEHASENGYIPKTNLNSYFRITEADADLFMAPYASNKSSEVDESSGEDELLAGEFAIEGQTNRTQFIGSAVFKEGKMIGKLDGEETRLAIALNDTINMSEILTTYQDPFNESYRIGARLMKKEKNKIKINLKSSTPTIDVTIPFYVDILSNHRMTDYSNSKEKREILKEYIQKDITKKFEKLIKRTQEEFKGESFGWSINARKEFMTIPEYEKFDWMKTYPMMNVKINVDIKFGKFGRQSELPHLEEVRD